MRLRLGEMPATVRLSLVKCGERTEVTGASLEFLRGTFDRDGPVPRSGLGIAVVCRFGFWCVIGSVALAAAASAWAASGSVGCIMRYAP
ncbi:MAG: hypothetical protein R3A78_06875 [Polyangiales bacterium]